MGLSKLDSAWHLNMGAPTGVFPRSLWTVLSRRHSHGACRRLQKGSKARARQLAWFKRHVYAHTSGTSASLLPSPKPLVALFSC